jgi:hypothetical protein
LVPKIFVEDTDFKKNNAETEGAAMAWNAFPIETSELTFVDNKAAGFINNQNFEPDSLAILIPRDFPEFFMQKKNDSNMIDPTNIHIDHKVMDELSMTPRNQIIDIDFSDYWIIKYDEHYRYYLLN